MYEIRMDGEILYSPAMATEAYTALAPKAALDINASGSLSFVLPPGNRLYSAIRRKKSVVTVNQDGEEIFRGRVLDDETDTYKQKSVYTEGVRSYLNDSLAAPYTYTGTPRGLLSKLIEEHNEQVEPEKQFTPGEITIDRADEALTCENVAYWETFKEIDEKLLSAYGGYMRVRVEGAALVLDWLKEYGRSNPQKIRFGVNLLDLVDKNDAGEVFTCLIPLGASEIGSDGKYAAPLTVASVNGGLNYIQDDEAVARYGRIWRAQTWGYEKDPAKLLEKGREYLKTGAELRTLSIRAIDMHLMDGRIDAIRIGDKVKIHVLPHGIDVEKVCSRIDIDLENPENTLYTFGEAPRMLTENIVEAEDEIDGVTGFRSSSGGGGSGRKTKEENNGVIRWAKIRVDEENAKINLAAKEIDSLEDRVSYAEIDIDGLHANILLKASREEVNDLGARLSQAEIEIDGANAEILLKAGRAEVDALGSRVSKAEIAIDGINSEIALKADKIDLQGYVTATQLSTELSNMELGLADSITTRTLNVTAATTTSSLNATNASLSNLRVGGYGIGLETATFLTSGTTLSVTSTGGTVTGVTLNKKTASISYLGW